MKKNGLFLEVAGILLSVTVGLILVGCASTGSIIDNIVVRYTTPLNGVWEKEEGPTKYRQTFNGHIWEVIGIQQEEQLQLGQGVFKFTEDTVIWSNGNSFKYIVNSNILTISGFPEGLKWMNGVWKKLQTQVVEDTNVLVGIWETKDVKSNAVQILKFDASGSGMHYICDKDYNEIDDKSSITWYPNEREFTQISTSGKKVSVKYTLNENRLVVGKIIYTKLEQLEVLETQLSSTSEVGKWIAGHNSSGKGNYEILELKSDGTGIWNIYLPDGTKAPYGKTATDGIIKYEIGSGIFTKWNREGEAGQGIRYTIKDNKMEAKLGGTAVPFVVTTIYTRIE